MGNLWGKNGIFILGLMLLFQACQLRAQTSADVRAEHHLGVDLAYSAVSLPFPGSKGIAANFNLSDRWQLGLSYMNSGFDIDFSKLKLAGFKERHTGLLLRRFFGNSFNITGAYIYRQNEVFLDPNVYGIPLGDQRLSTEAHTHMLQFGMANHWQFDQWTVAVDWFSLTLPLSGDVTKSVAEQADSDSNQRAVRTAENVLTWYPNLAFGTLRVGYMF